MANNTWKDLKVANYSVQSLTLVRLFAIPWTAAHLASVSITNSWSLPKLMSIISVMPSNHLILCRPLLLPTSIFPSIRVFSKESALCIRWPKYWSFSFSISPSNECSGLISFRIDWLDLLAVQGSSLLEKCKLKLQWGITSHQSESPSPKNLQIINAGEGLEKREPFCAVGGSVSWLQPLWRTVWRFLKKPGIKLLPAMWAVQETWVRCLGWEYPLEEGIAAPLLYSCLENPMDRGAWQAAAHRVAKSWTRLSTHIVTGHGSNLDVHPETSCMWVLWQGAQVYIIDTVALKWGEPVLT